MSIEELEETHLANINGKDIVFGYMNDKWEKMKSQMENGDYLVEFESSPSSWRHLAGRKGIRHMRGEEVINTIIMCMN